MKKADLVTSVVLLALAGYVIDQARRMPPSATFAPGAGFLPFWLGVLLALLAALLIAGALCRSRTPEDRSPFPGKRILGSVAGVLLGLAAYISCMETLGFVVNTLLFVAYLLLVVERARLKLSMLTAVLITACLFVVFQVLLGIPLPKGALGF